MEQDLIEEAVQPVAHELSPRERKLAEAPILGLVFSYSLPAIIGMLVNALYNVVDRYWIGQMNNVDAMSGIGLTLPISTILLGFMQLVGVGATASISIRLGQRRREDAERILANGLTLCLIIGGGLSAAILLFLDPILVTFGASAATLPYARAYARIIVLGNIINTTGFAMNHTIRGGGNPRRSASTQLLGAALNMVLDPLMIFGFHWGVEGAAIATVLSQFISAVWVLSYYLFRSKSIVRLRFSLMRLRGDAVRQILSIGVSPFVMQIAASLVTVVANRTLRDYGGDIAIGAMTVINSVGILFMMPLFGLNQGLQPILGFNYGARQFDRVKSTWRCGVLIASGVVVTGFLVVQLFPAWIIRQFIQDPGLIAVGTTGIRTFLAMLPLLGFQIISTTYFQSIGKARIAILASLLRQVILLLPLYLVLPQFFGLNGVWFAGPTADLLSTGVVAILITREMMRLQKIRQPETQLDGNPPAAAPD